MPKNEPYFIKAEQGEGKDHSIIYLDGSGQLKRYIHGHWNWRANNPGNVHVGTISKKHSQIGVVNKLHCRNLAIFPNKNIGHDALIDCLRSYYSNLSLHGLAWKYAPPEDHNDPARYERDLRRATGIKDNRPIRKFTDEQFQKLLVGIENEEGGKIGRIIDMCKITCVHKKNSEIFEYYIEEIGWITKTKCIALAKAKEIDAYVVPSKLGTPYVRSRMDSSFQADFEKLVVPKNSNNNRRTKIRRK